MVQYVWPDFYMAHEVIYVTFLLCQRKRKNRCLINSSCIMI